MEQSTKQGGDLDQREIHSGTILRALIVDDEPLAIERLRVICDKVNGVEIVGTAGDGKAALDLCETLFPDLILLDMTMPEMDGLTMARTLAQAADKSQKPANTPTVIFVTAHENFAVAAFDLDAVDYVLKPVSPDRLQRAIDRAILHASHSKNTNSTSDQNTAQNSSQNSVQNTAKNSVHSDPEDQWLRELWVPHRSELLRIDVGEVSRIDAERDYVRLHVGSGAKTADKMEGEMAGHGEAALGGKRSYLLLQTIIGLEKKLDPARFIRIHRSTILRRDTIRGLKHDGLGVWSVELENGEALRIGRKFLPNVKAMAGR